MERGIVNKTNLKSGSINAYSTGLLQGTAYSRLHSSLTKTLLPLGVSIPEWKLLGQLHEHGRIRLAALADLLNYDPPMVTKLAKSLEKRGLVKRSQDVNDERSKFIIITNNGTSLINNAEPVVKKEMSHILTGITEKELLIYIKVLSRIVENTSK